MGLRFIYHVARHTDAQVQSRERREDGGSGAPEGKEMGGITSTTQYVRTKLALGLLG